MAEPREHPCPQCDAVVPVTARLGSDEVAKCPACGHLHSVPRRPAGRGAEAGRLVELVWVEENHTLLTKGSSFDRWFVRPGTAALGFGFGLPVTLLLAQAFPRETQDAYARYFIAIPLLMGALGFLFPMRAARGGRNIALLPSTPDNRRVRVDAGRVWIPTVLVLSSERRDWLLEQGRAGLWIQTSGIQSVRRHVVMESTGNQSSTARTRITVELSAPWWSQLPARPPEKWVELVSDTRLALWVDDLPRDKQDDLLALLAGASGVGARDETA